MYRLNISKRLLGAHYIFIFIALIFGLIFIQITPPLWGTDETSHFARTYQLAHGQLLPSKDKQNYGGSVPGNLLTLIDHSKVDLADNKGSRTIISRKDVNDTNSYALLKNQKFSNEKRNFLWTASYSPVAYVGSIVGVLFADVFRMTIGQTIFLGRLGALLMYVAIVAVALRLLINTKLKWPVFMVALLPAALYQASVITADNIAIALSLLFTALFIRVNNDKDDKNRKLLFSYLVGVAILLPLVKINYIFLSFGILLVPNNIFKSVKLTLVLKAAGLSVVVLLGIIWSSVMKITSDTPISQRPDGAPINAGAQVVFMEHHPLEFLMACMRTVLANLDSYLQSMTSLMGWNYVAVPFVLTVFICLGLFISAIYAKDEASKLRRKFALLTLLSLAGIASIYGALYIAFNPVGNQIVDGIQGRYFIPFLVPIVIILASIVPFEVKIKDKLAPYIFMFICSASLLISVTYYYLATY